MFKINEIVISNTTPLTTNVIWVKPVSFGLYKLLVYTDSGWTSVSPDESKQALINASTEYNTLHSVETLTLQQAVNKVPETDKGLGKMITYFDGTNWQFRQYAGTTLSGWNAIGNWVTVSSSTIDYTGFPLYNITTTIPLTAGQYYTATTARAAVPVNIRKRGLELLYETSAGVWYSERFIGTSVADWTIVNNWEAVLSKTYIDTQDALKIDKTSITSNFGNDETKILSQKGYTDDMTAWLPSAVYSDRVSTDSGSIKDKVSLFETYRNAFNLLPNTVLAYSPELGIKQSITDLVYKGTKLYDISNNNNDGSQGNVSNQPYIGGNIAPNEKQWLWGNGKYISHNAKSFANNEKWSFSWVGDLLYSTTVYFGASQGSVSLTSLGASFTNTLGTQISMLHSLNILNRTTRHYLICRGLGEIEYWVNGVLRAKTSIADTSITFQNLYTITKTKSVRIFNKDLSKSEIENLDKFFLSIYLEHETTIIGSQSWHTSNQMINTTQDLFNIPEIQANSASITYLSNFASGIDNFEAITNATLAGNIDGILGVDDVLKITITTANTSVLRKAITIPYGAFKITFDYYIPNADTVTRLLITDYNAAGNYLDTNVLGFTKGSWITITGYINLTSGAATTGLRLFAYGGSTTDEVYIKNFKVENMGWSDAQAAYDSAITAGKTNFEAVKTAAMWCKYNNNDDNVPIYGYILNWWAAYLLSINPPIGLRYPTELDTDQLRTTLGGYTVAGGKLKKEGTVYFNSPNTGATNESGFTAVGGGIRLPAGGFVNVKDEQYHWVMPESSSTLGKYIVIRANSAGLGATATLDKRYGMSVRFLKNAPSGPETQELDTGLFTTDIVTAQKELTMSFGHKVVEVKVNSLTNNLTNFKVELRNSAGVFIQNIVQGISITANAPVDIPVIITQPILFQDAKLWITATGNTGTNNLGMQVKILTKQIMY